jgi:Cu2+-exporting ATPase
VTHSEIFGVLAPADSLAVAAALERQSEHPIACAILAAAEDGPMRSAAAVRSVPGGGVAGSVDGLDYVLGTPGFVSAETGHLLPEAVLTRLRAGGRTVVLLAGTAGIAAAFVLEDTLRPGAAAMIGDLKAAGAKVVLLTGDHEQAARSLAAAVGIDDIAWDQKPADKLERVRALQAGGAVVAMVGDGVNDAPVLAQAQVSVAMGSGTQLAAATADMILLSEQLETLAVGVAKARRTLAVIRQNLFWAVGYNLLALPAAAMGLVAPWAAAIGMSASSLLVVTNALRLVERRTGSPASIAPGRPLGDTGAAARVR